MEIWYELLMLGTGATLIALSLALLVLHFRFLNVLREDHGEQWRALGAPTLIWNSSLKNQLATWRFIRRREYLGMGNPRLTRVARALRFVGYFGVWLATALVAAVVILGEVFVG